MTKEDPLSYLEFTILGCGSSGGVPRVGNVWGACDPNNPKNRRLRCALLVRRFGPNGSTTALIDTGPDVREQLVRTEVGALDGVIYTHSHADHLHGIDDLRQIAISMRQRVPVYMDEPTSKRAHEAFEYCFVSPPGSNYPPILEEYAIKCGTPVIVRGAGGIISFMPYMVHHGEIDALMFRIDNVLYTPDVKSIPKESLPALDGLDTWIVDALRRTPHPSHFSLDDAVSWIHRANPARAIITNMHTDMDYQELCEELPDGIEPAYDGLVIRTG
ncbi:MAG: MBL fold metallo-hydrolase [Stappiaceae bacterium]